MHPMFVKLFIDADAEDLLAEEEARRRRAGRSRRDRAAVAVRGASRDRNLRPDGDGRPSACPRLPGSTQHARSTADEDAGSALVDRFEEFQPIAVRILTVEAAHPGEVFIKEDRGASGTKPAHPLVQVMDQ